MTQEPAAPGRPDTAPSEPGSPDGNRTDAAAWLRLAIDHHRAGRLAPALHAYERVLAADPQHADALHLYGIAAFHGRNPGSALRRLRSALAVRPDFADAYNSLGNLLSDQGRLEDATIAYHRAINVRRGYADALGNLGVAYQARGRYDEAAAAYADALAIDSTLTGPRHNLGILHRACGRLAEAAACFFEVVRAVPQHAQTWRFLALTLSAMRHGDAEVALRRALADAPTDRELAFEFGRLLGDLGRHAEAETVLLPAVVAHPADTLLRFALGRARHGQGRLAEAAEDYRRALAGDPTLAGAWNNLGVALLDLDRFGDAAAALRVAVAIDPADPVAFNNLGSGYDGHDRPADARRAYAHALTLRPDYGKALNNLANVRDGGTDRRREARLRRAAIATQPDHVDAYVNLGATLRELDRPQEAETSLRRARRLAPLSADALTGLGLTWQLLGRPVDAERAHRAALVLTPDHGEAQANLGMLLWSAFRVAEAGRALARSLAAAPALASARLNFALVSLAEGRLPEGWENYRWRFRGKGYGDRPIRAPEWMGGPIPNRRLLVWSEQGVGDEILFASCVPEVMRRVATGAVGSVVVECDRRLVSLFARSFPMAEVVASVVVAEGWGAAPPPECDAHSPTGALPRLFRRSLTDFGGDVPWLKPDPARVAVWGERVAALGEGLRIGIAWRSQMMTHERRGAYVTLDDFAPLFALAGVRFVNLQYGDCATEMEAAETRFGVRIHRWDDLNLKDDFEAAAALIVNLDLVITPAMSAGELAGALGVPVWRLGHRDWTQLGSGARPWYPSHRLFQPRPGESLADVLGRIARVLSDMRRSIPQSKAQSAHQSVAPAVQPTPAPDVEPIVAAAIERYRDGDRDGAERLCRSALDQRPDHAVALHLLGVLRMRRGDPESAATVLRQAGQSDPGNAAAHAALADAWQALARPEMADAALRDALAAQPDGAFHWVNRTALLRKLGRPEEAEGCARRAIRLRPDLGVAHSHLGDLRGERGDPAGALASHRRALALEPARSEALVAVATLLRDADRVAEAIDGLRRATVAAPDSPAAWTVLGDLHDRAGRGGGARGAHERALALAPDLAQAHANLGMHWSRQGRAEEAVGAYLRALAVDPGLAVAHYNLALRLLEAGAIRPGWGEHEWRFGTPQFRGQERRLTARTWRGENAATSRLLVWREQGVGDELLFSSCYPDVLRRAGRLIVECDRRLVTLLARSLPGATVRPVTADPRDVDIQIAAGSLPRLLRGDLKRFPDREGWLVPDPGRTALWRERLAELGPGLTVGVSWRSQIVTGERRAAYTTLDQWGPLFAVPGVVFVNLQYGDCEAELADAEARFGVRIHRWSDLDLKDDFDGTAALTANLGLVVCPATAVGELAGGLGVPVWRIGRPDWTQLGSGARPWFPSHRLFQPRPGEDLGDVLAHIARALRASMPALQPLPPPPSPLTAAIRDDPEALLERAAGLHRAGRRDEAAPLYEKVLRARPDDPVALHLSGLLLHQDGRSDAGAARIARALELLPDYTAAQSSLGTVLLALDRPLAAVERFHRALALQPGFAAALTNLGNALDAAGMLEAAATAHRRAIAADPDLADALDNCGAVLTRLGRAAEAAALHRAALNRTPLSASAWMNLGIALREVGRWDDAGHALRRALAVEPGSADGAANLARLSRDRGAVADAERWSARALAVDPDNAGASFTMGLLRLARGNLEAGWAGYDARFRARELSGAARALDLPPWRGEELGGRRLLVWREQGIGDQILFGTALPEVTGKAGAVVVECDSRLVPLFARSFPGVAVSPSPADPAEPCPGVDRQVGMGSLGRWLRRRLTDFPDRRSVLVADSVRVAAWRDRLAALGPGLRVGIAWRSGLMTAERSVAYAALEHWGSVFAGPGLHFVTLQYGDCEAEVTAAERRFGVTIHRWPDLDLKDDLDGVAALISGLDLVLSPASSVAEMAGALGVPVWRFAPAPDWTSLGTAVRPWYPAMRLIHAPPGEPAAGALPRIAALLRRLRS